MTLLRVFQVLLPLDLRSLARDSFLVYIPFSPLLLALFLRFGIPALEGMFQIDIATYSPLLMSGYLFLVPTLVGVIVGFLLLDEKDEQTLSTLQVTPLPMTHYLIYRLGTALFFGLILTLLCYPLANLSPISIPDLLILTLFSTLNAPFMALILAVFAQNKVAGLALLKLTNNIMLLPMISYFLTDHWHYVAGLLPTFWLFKSFWLAASGENYFLFLGIGCLWYGLILKFLLKRISRMTS